MFISKRQKIEFLNSNEPKIEIEHAERHQDDYQRPCDATLTDLIQHVIYLIKSIFGPAEQ